MFDDIRFTTYGRAFIGKNWFASESIGINRIYYIHSGEVYYSGQGRHDELKQGHLYLFPQNLKFELDFDKEKVIDHTYFDFVTTPPIKLDNYIEIDLSEHKLINSAAKILQEIGEEYPVKKRVSKRYRELVKSYTKNLLFLIDEEVGIKVIEDERINNAIKHIHKNIEREITIEELASISCTERNYFIKLFKKNMFVTPYQYIKNYRMTKAVSLLERGYPVSDVGIRIGYSDVSAFSHAFKKEYGIYPSEFIKQKKHS